ncbi:YtxH domain-containing protein [Oxalobacteraceae bacterium OM1]|nr:YtxH domain-containing protein [Oxalobacteraceae bacterium OM1]
MLWMFGGFALGALAMYMLDPDRGTRRRALVRDKLTSAASSARDTLDSQSKQLADRARGLSAEVSRSVREQAGSFMR